MNKLLQISLFTNQQPLVAVGKGRCQNIHITAVFEFEFKCRHRLVSFLGEDSYAEQLAAVANGLAFVDRRKAKSSSLTELIGQAGGAVELRAVSVERKIVADAECV